MVLVHCGSEAFLDELGDLLDGRMLIGELVVGILTVFHLTGMLITVYQLYWFVCFCDVLLLGKACVRVAGAIIIGLLFLFCFAKLLVKLLATP